MQLFTIGLNKLNSDGTNTLDSDGNAQRAYTNDDIEEYARAWTGFVRSGRRGNIEELLRINQIDPLKVVSAWRDRLPKYGLDGKYVGDGYLLCADLPRHHFLHPGATFRLLDSSAPELHEDRIEWRGLRESYFLLQSPSQLYTKLSASAPELKIVLDAPLACTGTECQVDTLRVVGLSVGGTMYYYEYIRQPCVYQGFLNENQVTTIAKRKRGSDPMCGEISAEIATKCCRDGNSWDEMVSQLYL